MYPVRYKLTKRNVPAGVRASSRSVAKPLKEQGFAIDGGRLTITDPDMLVTDTSKLLRLFWLANERDIDIHPEAMTAARRSLWPSRVRRAYGRGFARNVLDIVAGKNHRAAFCR